MFRKKVCKFLQESFYSCISVRKIELDETLDYNQILQLCTSRTAWSESDRAVRTVHSCNSW